MHIQKRGNRIEIVRTKYCPIKKRGVAKIIGAFPNWHSSAPQELIDQLDDKEKAKLEAWFKENADISRKYSLDNKLQPYSHKLLCEAVGELEVSKNQARELFLMMDSVKKSLRKKGYTRKNTVGNIEATEKETNTNEQEYLL